MVLVIDLNGKNNLKFRKEVNDYVDDNWDNLSKKFNRSRNQSEDSKKLEIKKGYLAQYVIRTQVGLAGIDSPNNDLSADLTNANGIKIDVKNETVKFEFQEHYMGTGDILRQAKHNFFPRQLYDTKLNSTDIFLVTRLRTGDTFPGSGRLNESRWKLWVCGWVSKIRVRNEGILIPRGGITEQGSKFFDYRSNNVEFYQLGLNPITDLYSWFENVTKDDIKNDEEKNPDDTIQCTIADGQRILGDLLVRKIINDEQFSSISNSLGLDGKHVPSILHHNHTIRFVKYLVNKKFLTHDTIDKLHNAGIAETTPQQIKELERFFQ